LGEKKKEIFKNMPAVVDKPVKLEEKGWKPDISVKCY